MGKLSQVFFENFKVGKNKSFYFNALISEFGQKGKIKFNLVKKVKHKRDSFKKVEIIGFLIPSNSRIIFNKLLVDDIELFAEIIKEHENKFQDELIRDNLANIFNEAKMEKFFKNLF